MLLPNPLKRAVLLPALWAIAAGPLVLFSNLYTDPPGSSLFKFHVDFPVGTGLKYMRGFLKPPACRSFVDTLIITKVKGR